MSCHLCLTSPATVQCPLCFCVEYCSEECLNRNQKQHKKTCVSNFIIKKDYKNYEDNFEAIRDIKQDTMILEESPIFQIPHFGDDVVCCLSCSIPLKPKITYCSVCSWPICSDACAKLRIHKDYECKFFSSNQIPYNNKFQKFIVSGIRLYMLKKNNQSGSWEKLLNMVFENVLYSPLDVKQYNTHYYANNRESQRDSFAHSMLQLLNHNNNNKDNNNDTLDDDIFKTLKNCYKTLVLLDQKGFVAETLYDTVKVVVKSKKQGSVEITEPNIPNERGVYLYGNGSRIKHSETPNCIYLIGNYPDFKLRLRTLHPIKKGDQLTISRSGGSCHFNFSPQNQEEAIDYSLKI